MISSKWLSIVKPALTLSFYLETKPKLDSFHVAAHISNQWPTGMTPDDAPPAQVRA
jgi:hypothetical protein